MFLLKCTFSVKNIYSQNMCASPTCNAVVRKQFTIVQATDLIVVLDPKYKYNLFTDFF